MKNVSRWIIALAVMGLAAVPAAAGEHRLGLGAHYWQTVDELEDDNFSFADEDGFAWVGSYQFVPAGLFKLEFDLEYFPDGFGGAEESAWSPQIYVVVGSRIYVAVGTGVVYSDGYEDDVSDPFYAARAGFEFAILPRTSLDIHGNYRFNDWNEIEQADTDTITLGALLRVTL